jgi:hypothetical protein
MANGIPVRLSADLAQRARTAAETAERSVTEQVEHWARLGQAVEDVVLAKTVQRLKARSHDADLSARIALADSAAGRAKALELIKTRNSTRYGVDAKGELDVARSRMTANTNATHPSANVSANANANASANATSPPSPASARAKAARAEAPRSTPKRAPAKKRAR